MMHSTTKSKPSLKNKLIQVAAIVFWLVVWQTTYRLVAKEILVVSPLQVLVRFFQLMTQVLFWKSIVYTCVRVMVGFLLAFVLGIILGAVTAKWKVAYILFKPLLEVVRATPVVSIIILALVWMANDILPVFIAFLMVLPMSWSNTFVGISQVDNSLLEMAKIYRFSPMQKFKHIYFPSVLPYLISVISSGIGFAWKSVIAAEVIALPKISMGKQIYNAKIYLETLDVFAWTVGVIILSVMLEKATLLLVNKLKGGGIS